MIDLPGRDGYGPMGCGPMTGRAFGRCVEATPVRYGGGFGRGRASRCGYGNGYGRGFGRGGVWELPTPETQKEVLEEQRKLLKDRLSAIDEQLNEL